jgi:hypothetical protein
LFAALETYTSGFLIEQQSLMEPMSAQAPRNVSLKIPGLRGSAARSTAALIVAIFTEFGAQENGTAVPTVGINLL